VQVSVFALVFIVWVFKYFKKQCSQCTTEYENYSILWGMTWTNQTLAELSFLCVVVPELHTKQLPLD